MVIIFLIAGLVLLIPVILFLTLYAENILFLDSLILSVIVAVLVRTMTGIHPVFCILTGVAVLVGMMLLYSQHCLFWIITVTSSMLWGSMIGVLLHGITKDLAWDVFLGMIVSVITLAFHLAARERYYG